MSESLAKYDPAQTYRWNYVHAPEPVLREVPEVGGEWDFCGLPVDSPLGISAGPLLNGKWCLYYASLGFDVVTYKTVRSIQRDCYPLPNLQPVRCGQLTGQERCVETAEQMRDSWAVSFGMPSAEPETWRADVEWTRGQLATGKILSVSVVGTVQENGSLQQLADDYAVCARWAVESGADCVEINFSCPNVSTCDGQLYQDPEQSQLVAETVRAAIGDVPLILKVGHVESTAEIASLVSAVDGWATALAMTNSVATQVSGPGDELLFGGQKRGICGHAIRDASIDQLRRFHEVAKAGGHHVKLIGVGGISTAEDVQAYLDAGANACHLATAAMIDPSVGIKIRKALS